MPLNFKNEGGGDKLYREPKPKQGKKTSQNLIFIPLQYDSSACHLEMRNLRKRVPSSTIEKDY